MARTPNRSPRESIQRRVAALTATIAAGRLRPKKRFSPYAKDHPRQSGSSPAASPSIHRTGSDAGAAATSDELGAVVDEYANARFANPPDSSPSRNYSPSMLATAPNWRKPLQYNLATNRFNRPPPSEPSNSDSDEKSSIKSSDSHLIWWRRLRADTYDEAIRYTTSTWRTQLGADFLTKQGVRFARQHAHDTAAPIRLTATATSPDVSMKTTDPSSLPAVTLAPTHLIYNLGGSSTGAPGEVPLKAIHFPPCDCDL
jgi:hypothetical protein